MDERGIQGLAEGLWGMPQLKRLVILLHLASPCLVGKDVIDRCETIVPGIARDVWCSVEHVSRP